MRSWRAFVATLAVGLAACSSDPGALPPPPDIPPAATTTTGLDFAEVGLRGVPPGRTPVTTIPIGPGRATLSGSIIGPEGLVPDADILVERIVNDGVGTARIKSGPDGLWTLPNVLGGRYRIRAWRSPDFALLKPTIAFVMSAETRTFDLRVARYGGVAVKAAIAPNPPPVGQASSLVVRVTTRTVDENGVVRATPVPGVDVELVGSGQWRVESENPAQTNSKGESTWMMRCREEGRQSLAATIGDGDTFPLDLPDCVIPPPPPTTVEEESPSTSEPTASTTTTTSRN